MRLSKLPLATALLTVACGVLAATAHASSVTAVGVEYYIPEAPSIHGTEVQWTAAPGEANRLRATETLFGLVLRDGAGPIRALRGCTALPDGAALCGLSGEASAAIRLLGGDGDDELRVDVTGGSFAIDGGEGDDTLVAGGAATSGTLDGGTGDDTIAGGPGTERIFGGAGADTIDAGAGSDSIVDDPPAGPFSPDRIEGGPNDWRPGYADYGDAVGYDRDSPVHVDLGAGSGGAPGEGDVLSGVESASGGTADDVLIGDDGPNGLNISGYSRTPAGDDRVEGRGGDDSLRGSDGGSGLLLGGDGDDAIAAWSDTADGGAGDDRVSDVRGRARCGDGHDSVSPETQGATIAADCERIRLHDVIVADLRADGRRLRLTVGPWTGSYRPGCGVRLKLRDAADRRLLARAFVRLGRRQRRTAALRAAGPLPAGVVLSAQAVVCRRGRPAPAPPGDAGDGFLFESSEAVAP